jgi:hypothetical protein
MNYPSRTYNQTNNSQIVDIDVSLNQQKQYYQQINNTPKPAGPKNPDIIQTLQIDSTYRDRTKFPLPSDFRYPYVLCRFFFYCEGRKRSYSQLVSCCYKHNYLEVMLALHLLLVLNGNSLPYNSVYNNYYLENDCNSICRNTRLL